MGSATSAQGRLHALDALRGIAAVLVMLYHFSHYLPGSHPLLGEGYAGVDIFFVLSGFVIVYTTRGAGRHDTPRFLWRRFWRVVPLAWIATGVYYWLLAPRPSGQTLMRSLAFLPTSHADPPVFGAPIVTQEWTLRYELLFYGLCAIALLIAGRSSALLAAIFVVAAAAWCHPVMLEFLVGMGLAAGYLRSQAWLSAPAHRLQLYAAAVLLVAVFLYNYLPGHGAGDGLGGKGYGAGCLVAAALLIEAALRRRSQAVPSWIAAAGAAGAAISYPLYLFHAGIGERTLRFLSRHTLGTAVTGGAGFTALVVWSLLLAVAIHFAVERPLIKKAGAFAPARREP